MAADKRKQKAKGKSRVTKKTQAAAKDPGPPYRALWHPAADAERDASWPPEEKVAMLHAVQKLEAGARGLGAHTPARFRVTRAKGCVSFDPELVAAGGVPSTAASVRPRS
jgi:hypothetical protein